MPEKNELEEEKVFDLSAAQNIKDPGIESRINLNGYTYLTSDAAKTLSVMKINNLELDSITHWEDGCAKELSSFQGLLFLGLTELSASDASHLSNHKCVDIHFTRISKLSPDTAESLASQCCGRFLFWELESISESESHIRLARAIADTQNQVCFPKVSTLTAGLADAISVNNRRIALGITSLNEECARMIARSKGLLNFESLRQITPNVAKSLSRHRGNQMMLGLKKMPVDVAEHLARYLGNNLSIGRNGLYDFSDDSDSDIGFISDMNNKLKENPDELQKIEFIREIVEYYSINSPTDEAVRAICQFQGDDLSLSILEYISEKSAKALAQFSGDRLELTEIKYINAEAAKLICKYKGRLAASDTQSFTGIELPKQLKAFIKKCTKR